MKRKKIIIILASMAIFGVLSAALIFRFVINKPHVNYEKARPAYIITAQELFDSFRNDRQVAEQKYNGTVVLLNGVIDKVEVANDQVTGVFIFDQGMFGDEGIRCTMLPAHSSTLKSISEGTEVRLKGFLAGYNETDVILEQCSVIL